MKEPRNTDGSVEGLAPADLEQVEVRFKMPRYLRRELHAAARAQTISLSSLLRIIALEFTRSRHKKENGE